MSAKAGVKHLQQRILDIGKDIDIQNEEHADSNFSSILWQAGNVMVEIMARISDDEMMALHDVDAFETPISYPNVKRRIQGKKST